MNTTVHTHTSNGSRVQALQELDDELRYCTDAVTEEGVSTPSAVTPGRKMFDGKDEGMVVAKLSRAFALDCTVQEACFYADISRYSFYRYLDKNPLFRNRIEDLRLKPVLAARKTLIDAFTVHGSWRAALAFLKAKRPEEFNTRVVQFYNSLETQPIVINYL